MFRGKESIFVTIICAAGMGTFVALWLLDFAIIRAGVCGNDETGGMCLRNWISALSGWAGATAAGITLLVLFEQVREQRKQTAYAVGEAEPDFIIERTPTAFRCNLNVINYSRHRIIVEKITVIRPEAMGISGFVLENRNMTAQNLNMKIEGSKDKNKAPFERDVDIIFNSAGKKMTRNAFSKQFTLLIEYRRIGPQQTRHSAIADALAYEPY